jgi:hypothetical protein
MSEKEAEKIPLAKLEMRERTLEARLAVLERSGLLLELLALDHPADEMFVGYLDRHHFAALKEFLADCDDLSAKLLACPVIMPSDSVPNPMSLRVEVGSLELINETLNFTLSFNRTKSVEVILSLSENDSDVMVFLHLGKTDYRRLKDWINEVEKKLQELAQSGYISKSF